MKASFLDFHLYRHWKKLEVEVILESVKLLTVESFIGGISSQYFIIIEFALLTFISICVAACVSSDCAFFCVADFL